VGQDDAGEELEEVHVWRRLLAGVCTGEGHARTESGAGGRTWIRTRDLFLIREAL
jgi:hypothetical protein